MNKKIVTVVAVVAIVAVMACMLVGCASVYEQNLKRADFEVTKLTLAEAEKEHPELKDLDIDVKYVVSGISAEKGAVTVVGLKTEVTGVVKGLINVFGEVSEDGKTIFIGTPNAIKAAKGL